VDVSENCFDQLMDHMLLANLGDEMAGIQGGACLAGGSRCAFQFAAITCTRLAFDLDQSRREGGRRFDLCNMQEPLILSGLQS